MTLQFIDIVNIVATFQLLVFIFFLMRKKSTRATGFWEQPNRLLSYFLFIQVIILVNFECARLQEMTIAITPHLLLLGAPFFFLAAPGFYWYVRSLAFSDFRFRTYDLLHLVPFLVAAASYAQFFYFLPAEEKIRLIAKGNLFSPAALFLYNGLFIIQFGFYFVAELRILRYYRSEIRQQYSSVSRINLSWLTVILYAFIVAWSSSVATAVARAYFRDVVEPLITVNFTAFFCFFNYIFYKGLSQPEIFSGIAEKPRYETSRLTADEGKEYLDRLACHMQSQKPFLNPTLTLKDLATQLSLSPRYLSQVINEHTRQNFYDFVNQYRIEEAKRLLSEKSGRKNITEILYAVGFNSKSSFNTAFKHATGVSPREFKKQTLSLTPDS